MLNSLDFRMFPTLINDVILTIKYDNLMMNSKNHKAASAFLGDTKPTKLLRFLSVLYPLHLLLK